MDPLDSDSGGLFCPGTRISRGSARDPNTQLLHPIPGFQEVGVKTGGKRLVGVIGINICDADRGDGSSGADSYSVSVSSFPASPPYDVQSDWIHKKNPQGFPQLPNTEAPCCIDFLDPFSLCPYRREEMSRLIVAACVLIIDFDDVKAADASGAFLCQGGALDFRPINREIARRPKPWQTTAHEAFIGQGEHTVAVQLPHAFRSEAFPLGTAGHEAKCDDDHGFSCAFQLRTKRLVER